MKTNPELYTYHYINDNILSLQPGDVFTVQSGIAFVFESDIDYKPSEIEVKVKPWNVSTFQSNINIYMNNDFYETKDTTNWTDADVHVTKEQLDDGRTAVTTIYVAHSYTVPEQIEAINNETEKVINDDLFTVLDMFKEQNTDITPFIKKEEQENQQETHKNKLFLNTSQALKVNKDLMISVRGNKQLLAKQPLIENQRAAEANVFWVYNNTEQTINCVSFLDDVSSHPENINDITPITTTGFSLKNKIK